MRNLRFLSFALILVSCFFLVIACGSDGSDDNGGNGGNDVPAASA